MKVGFFILFQNLCYEIRMRFLFCFDLYKVVNYYEIKNYFFEQKTGRESACLLSLTTVVQTN